MRKLSGFGLLSGQADEVFASLAIPRVEGRVPDFADYFVRPGAAAGKPVPPTIASDFPAVIDLTGLAAPTGFIIRGDAAGDFAGRFVAPAGDVNGDGFGDIIIGAPLGDNGGEGAGEAYVIFGKANGFGAIDLTTLAAADGFVIQGDMEGDGAGSGVSSAGDINGDGFDDIIVGAPLGDDGGMNAGEAYVIFGKAAGFANIDLSLLGTAEGFIIQGDADDDGAGHSVSSAGDVNGDGLDDIIIGAPYGDDGGPGAGEAYVIFGKTTTFANIDLATLAPADGFIIRGDAEGDRTGIAVASAGDVNGDGFDDLFIGASSGDEGGVYAGVAYVVFGKSDPFQNIDLAVLGSAEGFRIIGDAAEDRAGFSVAAAGDINGDGLGDMIVGAPAGDDAGVNAGEAYVIFGRSAGLATIDLTAFNPTDPNHDPAAGFIIRGDVAGDGLGFDVASAGDVNGDGFADIIVGAPYGGNGGVKAGQAYVIFGKATGFGLIDLTLLDVENGFTIQGDTAGDTLPDYAGAAVSSAGDVNGDGFGDILVGAPGGDDGGTDAGEAYVIFGRAPTEAANRIGSIADQAIRGGAFNDTLSGLGGEDSLFGGDGNDFLRGGAGADALAGGAGSDWADYTGAPGIRVDLQFSALNSGEAIGDSYDSIENLRGGVFADTLRGDGAANRLNGANAHDSLTGRDGDDSLIGGSGGDTLNGGSGADTLDGGSGLDWADYSGASRRIVADLQIPGNNTQEAIGDVYASIENLRGGDLADNLRGDGEDNRLEGGVRNDVLSGRGGDDTLVGGQGFDQLAGQAGRDSFLLESTDPADYDRIVGFALDETILLDASAFGLAPGALDPDAFVLGSGAQDAEDRLIYLESVGKLFFDPDGAGGVSRSLIAIIENRPTIDADNFIVI